MTKTIVVITLNGYNSYNRSLIHHIKKTTTYDIFLGWDDKSGKKEDEYNFINSYNSLLKHFGHKINNFNGRWIKNPAKLGAIYWFSKNKEANYMWLIEDDVYIRNGNKFFDSYENINSDLICIRDKELPFWFPDYRIGNKNIIASSLPLAHLYVVRFSKKLCEKIVEELKITNDTNHHELFIPYVVDKHNLIYSDLFENHKNGLKINSINVSNNHLQTVNYEIIHPYKKKIISI
jgi:hypothetical protein|tara:strand:+ start:1325 stop:2026 length:702 start_codon:yes stop_codon:yes gene_type:complete